MFDLKPLGDVMRLLCTMLLALVPTNFIFAQADQADEIEVDFIRQLQKDAVKSKKADWIHWGDKPGEFSNWQQHSNRLIPVYTFGMSLDSIEGDNSVYHSKKKIESLYQTLLYDLQQSAIEAGKKNIIILLFDGMDWQTTQAAAIYRRQAVSYTKGRGDVLSFQTYSKAQTDFGFCVTSCHNVGSKQNPDSQTITNEGGNRSGGYNAELGGATPWARSASSTYLMAQHKTMPHAVTDSAASATAIMTGTKTYNAGVGVNFKGKLLKSIAHQLQEEGRSVGVATSVPISHATPAATYAHNVTRYDYQDVSRDLLGLPSVSHHPVTSSSLLRTLLRLIRKMAATISLPHALQGRKGPLFWRQAPKRPLHKRNVCLVSLADVMIICPTKPPTAITTRRAVSNLQNDTSLKISMRILC